MYFSSIRIVRNHNKTLGKKSLAQEQNMYMPASRQSSVQLLPLFAVLLKVTVMYA